MSYEHKTNVSYKGIDYRVVEILDNFLLLVVPQNDINEKKFPLKPVVIPNIL